MPKCSRLQKAFEKFFGGDTLGPPSYPVTVGVLKLTPLDATDHSITGFSCFSCLWLYSRNVNMTFCHGFGNKNWSDVRTSWIVQI